MRIFLLVGAAAIVFADAASAQTPADAIFNGAPIFEVRPRFESASQDGVAKGEALTMRTRLGWRTQAWRGLTALVELEDVRDLGGDYSDGVPPTEPFATIPDPEGMELNRLELAWAASEAIKVTLGRQRINLDDQRFVGAVAWRQDEQTFDALRVDADLGKLDATYAYLNRINRVFGDALDWGSDSHLLNVSYTFGDPLKVTAFVYALDFTSPAGAATANNSNVTQGVRASGKASVADITFAYAASYARQSDYGASLVNYEADHYSAELAATWGVITGRVAYESLEGDGPNRRFQTPLATLHAFQGWADAFLATPNDGIDDFNVALNLRPHWRGEHLFNIDATIRHHDFAHERTGGDLGEEWDASLSAQITPRLGWLVKWADYDGPGGASPADRTKAWLGFEFRL